MNNYPIDYSIDIYILRPHLFMNANFFNIFMETYMTGAVLSIIINFLSTMLILFRNDISNSFKLVLFTIFFAFLILSITGTILYRTKERDFYAVMAMIGFGIFVPAGALGIFSIRKMMDKYTTDNYRIPEAINI